MSEDEIVEAVGVVEEVAAPVEEVVAEAEIVA
jgi:hypothetical protein